MSTGALPASVDAAVRAARARGLDRLDAHLLLAHVLGRSRAWLLAHGEDALAPEHAGAFAALVERRQAGEPFAYLVGEREFHGLTLAVGPGVLVPRPDTETLVDWALALLAGELRDAPAPALLDLGTGSGAIALALKNGCPRARVWAGERSTDALAIARANAQRLQLELRFAHGDWWDALDHEPAQAAVPPEGVEAPGTDFPASAARNAAHAGRAVPLFDLALSNPPYIAADDPHLAALAHEPRAALVAADDGLADIVRIAAGARARLRAGGWLLFEHGWTQADAVRTTLAEAGFVDVSTRLDIEGRPRCSGGRRASDGDCDGG